METDSNELAAGPRKYLYIYIYIYITAILEQAQRTRAAATPYIEQSFPHPEQQMDTQPVSLQGILICNLIL